MKVREILKALSQCNPEADVQLHLAEIFIHTYNSLAVGDPQVSFYPFPLTLNVDHSPGLDEIGVQADVVRIQVTDEATLSHFEYLKSVEGLVDEAEMGEPVDPGINAGARDRDVAVALLLRPHVLQNLRQLVGSCNASHHTSKGANTHGDLTVQSLLEMLAEDAGMVISRPGSWEGAGMRDLLSSHGYL